MIRAPFFPRIIKRLSSPSRVTYEHTGRFSGFALFSRPSHPTTVTRMVKKIGYNGPIPGLTAMGSPPNSTEFPLGSELGSTCIYENKITAKRRGVKPNQGSDGVGQVDVVAVLSGHSLLAQFLAHFRHLGVDLADLGVQGGHPVGFSRIRQAVVRSHIA